MEVQARDQGSSSTHKKVMRIRDYLMFGTFVCGVFGALIAGYSGAQGAFDDVQDRLDKVEEAQSASKAVDRFLMMQVKHTNNIIGHIVPKSRRHEIPEPPPGLVEAEMELLSQ